jgi:hypothetical protein
MTHAVLSHPHPQVKVFRLVHMHDTFTQYNSPITALSHVDEASVLVTCEDSSVRLVSAVDAESLHVTVPQLSCKSLVTACYSRHRHTLYVPPCLWLPSLSVFGLYSSEPDAEPQLRDPRAE